MPSDTGADPVEWGASSGLFGADGSDPAADPPDAAEPRRPSFGRRGSSLSSSSSSSSFGRRGSALSSSSSSSSFGSRRSGGGQRKTRSGGRPSGSRREPSDDPFGPVVGSSADAPPVEYAPEAPGDDTAPVDTGHGSESPESSDGRRSGGRSGGRPSRGGRTGAGRPDAPVAEKSDEEWTSEARSVLLRQLALGARSRHQLDQKLAERSVPPAVAASLLDRFEEVQLIDDAEFARMWVRTRTAAKALSRSSLRRELAEKGIDGELAEDALLQLSDEDEHEQARDVVRRRLRRNADLSDRAVREKEVRRLVGILARKGYSPGTAFSLVKGVLAEADSD
ncbi:regulatory protein RecX [Arthrobacter sp. Soc17.1.1.1]|uniref:regulatory protein RecX n=1 Tax=Arthrobacter sp. Soc17.1.1.1 TaxID=3121277 RepID=UPI002FE479EB